ncbi:hypothetical protein BD309DRAFT_988613 [Dichomitus squalens]|uniref:Uncharacterized protein n=2 Tax=Dichomitus squalens TaxID=114155 RepID=A0A4Q9P2D8_9APHY|nr:uncharacterized protein DICSQDRAFT_128102 [Dichomitus squalens LYAD-421 SS1]EJF59801.1 hypothetical protein DICSQDRAFT_128102 [Dichomitus squalens LYAD-421 SS1]TBU34328.1 hypothetical protein BD311DRAFT_774105 [Dichomitus squalens]TBU46711.1 hypothetical protein BD309DRAFT_988613 [Dichomitus squalens]TBU57497.1 hypothetical protein BD310DRAFT_949362 [Dichomitus squalens]
MSASYTFLQPVVIPAGCRSARTRCPGYHSRRTLRNEDLAIASRKDGATSKFLMIWGDPSSRPSGKTELTLINADFSSVQYYRIAGAYLPNVNHAPPEFAAHMKHEVPSPYAHSPGETMISEPDIMQGEGTYASSGDFIVVPEPGG